LHLKWLQSSVDPTPSLRAIRAFAPGDATATPLLTDAQREKLAALSTRLQVGPRTTIYREAAQAEHIFIISSGVVKSFSDLPSGKRRIAAFWFSADIFGLAEQGKFVNTTQSVTPATIYRIPVNELKAALLEDGHLQLQFLVKVTHEFREVQRQKIALTRRDAVGKVATFFSMLERQAGESGSADTITIPMTRSDIANFLGLSLEAVSRATRELTRRRLVAIPERHTVQILDRTRFDYLVSKI
jgi:CRP-like cAMP-binding protein